ncbi:AfsR/SARP family transcriptional regulator [Actinomadura rudentiformis]|uniref:AfsR family transcriptional regulator n=1 Tax=Actinomadura rudentiformis TaxID=359158 RepID=A0A6H9YAP3_9ACTN|nr:BTAD domain-containing putative transcriptional regulator [Actinomadura rudentiformis]KAB2339993.1 AfsR family transcriptional regulator [Actinomadura rudentiformis]
MSEQGVCFRVLGRLRVSVNGASVPPPGSKVLQGLLGVLVLARGEPLSAERLAHLVWADRAESTSRASVHVGVSRLRKWLERLDTPATAKPAIEYADGYLLRGASVDLDRFLDLIGRARTLTEPEARTRMLASALELRRGPLLTGLDQLNRTDGLIRTAEHLIREAVMDLADAALYAGTPEAALTSLTVMADELPFDEPLHAALIDVLAASGRPAEALHTFRHLSKRFGEELGVEPSEKVQEAHLRVLSANQPLGAHPGGAAGTRMPVPAELPPGISDFTGREAEAALLAERLDGTGGTRPRTVAVAMVAGMGGIGKTTLAVHVAHRLIDAFPGGQLYTDLRGDSENPAEPGEVLGRFLRTLGTAGSGVPPSLEERTALFRSRLAGRKMLVVLDNAASEEQVRPLLPGTPDAAVLITSRHRLTGLEGATLLNLDVLASAQAVELLAGIVGERRVAAEPDAAAEIVRLCGHVPLAVRIAAARLLGRPSWTLAHLASLLHEERRRLDELAVGDLEVRAGFEMSYRPLPAATRRAFRLAGLLYAPDFASWAVAALLDVPPAEAQDHLEALIDAHLVSVVDVDATGRLRYRMHDLIRLYARERAEAECPPAERAAALQRALGAWLWLAERAADHVPGPCYAAMHGAAPRWPLPAAEAAQLLKDPMLWFTAERPALVAEVRQACELSLDEAAWDLAASMEKYCDVRGLYEDWRHMHERALRLCQETGNKQGEAVLRRGLLEVTTWTSPVRSGPAMVTMRESAERLLQLFTELDDPIGMADAMVAIVWGLAAQGAESEALAVAEQSLRLSRTSGYPGGQVRAYHVMAVVHGERHPDRALPCLERALENAKVLGNPRVMATVMQFLGAARALCGDVEGGQRLLDDSIVIARELDDRYLETFSLLYLAKTYAATGDDRARPTAELAVSYSLVGNFRHHLADALAVLGELTLAAGDLPAAIACLERSVQVWRTRGWLPYLAGALRTLGDAHAAANDFAAAREAWTEARDLFARSADDTGRDSVDERLAAQNVTGRP